MLDFIVLLEQIDLLGFSHGGMVAAAYAAAHPDRVRKLVFASSLLAISEEMTAEAERVLASKSGEPWHEAAMAALAREEAADYETPEELAADLERHGARVLLAVGRALRPRSTMDWLPPEPLKEFNAAIPDIREAARAITAPTLVITGRDDFICGPAAAADAAASIPHAEVVLARRRRPHDVPGAAGRPFGTPSRPFSPARVTAMADTGTMRVKSGLAEMLKGGVIMDVVDAEQAKIAEDAGACAVMALERVPADIRRDGGVARMSDPEKITEIQEAVTIPVMAKCRIGHFVEAQILQALEIDYIDESEVLTPADLEHHVDKWDFTVPFVCGCTNLGEALRRISEGAAMIRTKGEAGTGDIVNAVTHMRVGLRRHPPAPEPAPRGALRRGEGAARAVRARPLGRRERPAAGRHVHRGRDRHAGRRGALHAARRRRRLRRLGDLQVRRPGEAREGDRRGDDALQRRRDPRPRLRGPRRADGRDLHRRARPRAAARDPRLVARRP